MSDAKDATEALQFPIDIDESSFSVLEGGAAQFRMVRPNGSVENYRMSRGDAESIAKVIEECYEEFDDE